MLAASALAIILTLPTQTSLAPDISTRYQSGASYEALPDVQQQLRADAMRDKRELARATWLMTLDEALVIAMQHNRDIIVERFSYELADTQVALAEAGFAPSLTFGSQWSQSDIDLDSTVSVAGTGANREKVTSFGSFAGQPSQFGFSKPLVTGGLLSADFATGSSFQQPEGGFTTFNPAWRSTTTFQLTQPVFRGGRELSTASIRIAQANRAGSNYRFHAALNALYRDVEIAYWELAIRIADWELRKTAVTQAETTLKKELRKLQIGESSRPAVGQARENYRRTRMTMLFVHSRLLAAERELRGILGLPGFDGRVITIPQDATEPIANRDWQVAVATMRARRPELASQRTVIQAAETQRRVAESALEPDVDVIARYSLPGLGGTFRDSMDKMWDDGTYSWTMGVQYNHPIGNCAGKAAFRQAQLEYRRQVAVFESIEYSLMFELQSAFQEVIAAESLFDESRFLREAADERRIAAEEYYELGESGIDFLLRSRTAHTDAMVEEKQNLFQLRQRIAQWEYAQGTIRDHRQLQVTIAN